MSKKGYHIGELAEEARRMANAAACLENVTVGQWIGDAIREKWVSKWRPAPAPPGRPGRKPKDAVVEGNPGAGPVMTVTNLANVGGE